MVDISSRRSHEKYEFLIEQFNKINIAEWNLDSHVETFLNDTVLEFTTEDDMYGIVSHFHTTEQLELIMDDSFTEIVISYNMLFLRPSYPRMNSIWNIPELYQKTSTPASFSLLILSIWQMVSSFRGPLKILLNGNPFCSIVIPKDMINYSDFESGNIIRWYSKTCEIVEYLD